MKIHSGKNMQVMKLNIFEMLCYIWKVDRSACAQRSVKVDFYPQPTQMKHICCKVTLKNRLVLCVFPIFQIACSDDRVHLVAVYGSVDLAVLCSRVNMDSVHTFSVCINTCYFRGTPTQNMSLS